MTEERVQRRLAAILAADVVGYSRLMEADEAGTLERLKTLRRDVFAPLVAEFGGRVFKTTGDGDLVEFASAVDAVQCAAAIQHALGAQDGAEAEERRIALRIGISLGDVIVEGDDLYGNGVNVAARLEAMAPPGGICISGNVQDNVRSLPGIGFEELGEQQVKNLEQPIPVYRMVGENAVPGGRPRGRGGRRRYIFAGAAVLLLGVAGALTWWRPWAPGVAPPPAPTAGKALELPDMPSIAVLPFNNMSSDPEQEYFSDGITEDIITDLSKLSGLFVVARNSSFFYKGKTVNPQTLGRELGVSHVLEGSVRKAGGRVRITAQLIDARTGNHQWAERYDREITDVFKVQDEVTRKIVSVLAVKLSRDDQVRMRRRAETTPEAYDMLLRGLEQLRRFTPATLVRSREFFLKAIALDPGYARAYANVAFTYANENFIGMAETPDENLEKSLEFAKQALALNPEIPQTHFALAFIYWQQRRTAEALRAASEVFRVAPNYHDGMVLLSSIQTFDGQYEKARDTITKALRQNPRYSFFYLLMVGRIRFALGDYQAAVDAYRQALARNPAFPLARRELAASYAMLGRLEDARWEAQEVLTILPRFTLQRERQKPVFGIKKDMDRYILGLRKAGIPE